MNLFHQQIETNDTGEVILRKLLSLSKTVDRFGFLISGSDNFVLYIGGARYLNLNNTSEAFDVLESFHSDSSREIVGFLGYDLKNGLEKLESNNYDPLEFPEAFFFESVAKFQFQDDQLILETDSKRRFEELRNTFCKLDDISEAENNCHPIPVTSREEYLHSAEAFKNHLQRGDIYEANYCIQFVDHNADFDPYSGFLSLWNHTQAPFSAFAGFDNRFILSGSPERYLKKSGQRLISQPIKGTSKRSVDHILDEKSKNDLQNDPKEQSENVMIVDLVRNDLSRVADRDSVKVTELRGLHTFKTVHHLISTVEADLRTDKTAWDALKVTFPMGSMTGAPKISAMKIIDQLENFKRGPYSGAFGVINPKGDFDFNVLIRTLVFNREINTLGFGVGSAITVNADPLKEYSECLLKADALIRSLCATQNEFKEVVSNKS